MNQSQQGWLIFAVAFGAILVALGTQISTFQTWGEMSSPAFVGQALIQVGSVIGAFWGGKRIPTS